MAVWTSPLRRAQETAELVGRTLGVEPVVLDELVRAVDENRWPADNAARTRAKYAVLAAAAAATA